ncbi:MAG: bifunctional DNA primase/polymerase [bacterium]
MSDAENPLLAAALEYAARGWPVLPLHTPVDGACTCGKANCGSVGKHPRTEHGAKDATTDEGTIRGWWSKWSAANVGIATGKASFVALDVDPRHGGDESLADLEQREGKLPDTVEALTGGGGRHVLLEYPEGGVRTRAGIASGLDVRSDGGFIVAPPSLHASGRRYEWELSSTPQDIPLAGMPAWLIALAGRPSRNGDRPEPTDATRIPEGQRNPTLTSLAGTMRRRGMSEEAIRAALRAENAARCDPPLDVAEVDRTAASVARYEPDASAVAITQRPQILVTGRQDRELLEEARDALYRADAALVYRDTGQLVRIDGSQLRAIAGGELHDRLARSASWVKATDDGMQSVRVPRHLIEPLLAAAGAPIPIVRNVVAVPAFVGEDFRLVTRPGLDGDTLYVGEVLDVAPIPEEPSAEDVEAARETLESWFSEFAFTDLTSKAHAIALPITLMVRAALPGRVPMFEVEAATAGTGKTTLAEIVCIAAHGEPPISTTWTRDGEEMGKRAASWVLSGRPVVLLDDVKRITGDPAHVLSSLITTGAIEVRAMRELANAGGRFHGVIITTGNNVQLDEEMPRKICRIRLESPEDPWTRTFRRADIHAWTLDHRAEIVRAVGVLVAAWKAIGRPPGPRSRPSFHEWAITVGGILGCYSADLQAAFLDPGDVEDMMTFGEGTDELRAFVEAWMETSACSTTLAASELVAVAERAGVLEGVMGDGNERSRASRLGRYLKGHRGQVIAGRRVVGVADSRSRALRWAIQPLKEEPR